MTDFPPLQSLLNTQATTLQAKQADAKPGSDVSSEFEALFVSQFVDEMLKTVEVSQSGEGFGGDMWRSFMSEAIAENLVERGGFGLAGNIDQMLAAYKSK